MGFEAMLAEHLNDRFLADTVTPVFTDVRLLPLQSGRSCRRRGALAQCMERPTRFPMNA